METTYRNILNQAFQDRTLANASYSLRSFARDLNMVPSNLSEILNGKKGISTKRSLEIAKALKLPEWQLQYFCDLIAKEHAKSPQARRDAKIRLQEKKQENTLHNAHHHALKALTSWVDLAILELTYLKDFKDSTSWISRNLNVDEAIVVSSVARLKSAKLLEVNSATGQWSDVSPLFSTTDGIPSESIRGFHRSVLNLALKKLENPDVNARTVKSVVFSISEKNIPRAKKVLDEAIAKLVSLADESQQEREDVMCFSTQLFSLLNSKNLKG